jgi:hypothetical protein
LLTWLAGAPGRSAALIDRSFLEVAMTRVIPLDRERTITAGAWWPGQGRDAAPSYDTVQRILADLDRQLDTTAAAARMAFAPIDIAGAESWPLTRHGQAAVYSEIRIAIAPGQAAPVAAVILPVGACALRLVVASRADRRGAGR